MFTPERLAEFKKAGMFPKLQDWRNTIALVLFLRLFL
jgi:hypothetical protein